MSEVPLYPTGEVEMYGSIEIVPFGWLVDREGVIG